MDNIMIKTAQGEQLNINVVRYFQLNGVEYLVFSLNEVDEGGYVKLYISKINGEIANTIIDDVEWNLIKDTVKTIIKSNKENLPLPVTDLDVRKLSNVQVMDQKVFKLSETFIHLLGANKKVEAYAESTSATLGTEISTMEPTNELSGLTLNSIQQNPIMDSLSSIEPATITESFVSQPEDNSLESIEPSGVNSFTTLPDMDNLPTSENLSSTIEPYDVNLQNSFSNNPDYKVLYENELSKNELLTAKIEKYKAIINNLKNIINESETF